MSVQFEKVQPNQLNHFSGHVSVTTFGTGEDSEGYSEERETLASTGRPILFLPAKTEKNVLVHTKGQIRCASVNHQTGDVLLQISVAFQPVQIFPQMPAPVNGTPQRSREVSSHDVDNLVLKVLEIQGCRQQIHQLQEELNWEKQESEPMQGTCCVLQRCMVLS